MSRIIFCVLRDSISKVKFSKLSLFEILAVVGGSDLWSNVLTTRQQRRPITFETLIPG